MARVGTLHSDRVTRGRAAQTHPIPLAKVQFRVKFEPNRSHKSAHKCCFAAPKKFPTLREVRLTKTLFYIFLKHLHKYGIFAKVAPRIDIRRRFRTYGPGPTDQPSYICNFSIQSMKTVASDLCRSGLRPHISRCRGPVPENIH